MLNKKVVIMICSVLILFAGYPVTAASVAKKGSQVVPVTKDLPVTQVKINPQLAPVQKSSPALPEKYNQQAVPGIKIPSQAPPEQPSIKTQHNKNMETQNLKGFCCIKGIVQKKQTFRRECTSRKGRWYSSMAEAKRQCLLLSGYCIVKNDVILPTSQKRCDQLSGTYFKNRSEAQVAVVKKRQKSAGKLVNRDVQAGFCNVQGNTIPNIIRSKCEQLKGIFYDKARSARLAIVKEKRQKSGETPQSETKYRKPQRLVQSHLQETGKPVQAISRASLVSLSTYDQTGNSNELYLPEKSPKIHDPFYYLPKDGMFKPFAEELRTPMPEGLNPGKMPGWGHLGNDPGRDHWAEQAERIWDDPSSGWRDYLYAVFLWLHVDNDIDQRSGIPRDGSSGSGGGSGINSGTGTGGNDNDDSDDDDSDDDDSDDSGGDQEDDQSSDNTGSEDENTDDDQEEDSGTSEEDYQTGGDRGGRGGVGPSLGAQLSESLSIDLSTGRKKNERLTGGGNGGGHISTPLTQPGKGDEHQSDTPDIQVPVEDDSSQGVGIGPVVQHETPNPPGVGPNSQPSVDYDDNGPGIIMNNGNPIRLPDWLLDDPRVQN